MAPSCTTTTRTGLDRAPSSRSRGSTRCRTGSCSRSSGYPRDVNPLDHSVSPRGFRILAHIPRLPETVVKKVVNDLGDLESIIRASQRDLEAISGVGTVRAREIREGLRRLQEHNLVDRYLQL